MSGVAGQVCLPVETVNNPRLSYTAIGLLMVSLEAPKGSAPSYRDLMGRGIGNKNTRVMLRLLEVEGLRWRCVTAIGKSNATSIVLVYPTRPCLEQVIADVRQVSGNQTAKIRIMGGPESEVGKTL